MNVGPNLIPVFFTPCKITDQDGPSLIEMFIQGCAGEKARMMMACLPNSQEKTAEAVWSGGLLEVVKIIARLLYPFVVMLFIYN